MDFMTGLRVSSSGMTAQRHRMNAISSNIANIAELGAFLAFVTFRVDWFQLVVEAFSIA